MPLKDHRALKSNNADIAQDFLNCCITQHHGGRNTCRDRGTSMTFLLLYAKQAESNFAQHQQNTSMTLVPCKNKCVCEHEPQCGLSEVQPGKIASRRV